MTYSVAVPRFKPRPSLDCLREPLVPIESPRGARPALLTVTPPVVREQQQQVQPQLQQIVRSTNGNARPTVNITTDRHVLGTPVLNPQVHVPSTPTRASPLSYPIQQPTQFPSQEPPSPNPPQSRSSSRPPSRRTSLLQVPGGSGGGGNLTSSSSGSGASGGVRGGGGVLKKEKKRRNLTPLRNATVTYEELNAEEEFYDDYNPADVEAALNDDSDPYFERERSPSEFFETAVSYPVLLPPSHSQSGDKAKNGSKKKSRLHLSLGRLGRQKELNETIRVRDELDYRVANPTFTRENLFQRNYDAFFESGEPVYSLERRTLDTPDVSFDQSSSFDSAHNYPTSSMSSPLSNYSGGQRHSQNNNFFQHGLSTPGASAMPRPKTVSYLPMGVRGTSPAAQAMLGSAARAQSVELDSRHSAGSRRGTSVVTPKGDRCPSFNRFGLFRVEWIAARCGSPSDEKRRTDWW